MLRDLISEEGEATNHVGQLITFSEALGLSKDEVLNSKINKNTSKAIETFLELAQDKNINKGLSALATYKEQIRKVAGTKEQGLRDYYGIFYCFCTSNNVYGHTHLSRCAFFHPLSYYTLLLSSHLYGSGGIFLFASRHNYWRLV